MRSQLEVRELWNCALFGCAGNHERPSPGTTSPLQGWTSPCAVDSRRSQYVPFALHLLPRCCYAQLNKERVKEKVTCRLPDNPDGADLPNHAQDVRSVHPVRPIAGGRRPACSSRQRVRPARSQMAATAWIATVAQPSPWQPAKQKPF